MRLWNSLTRFSPRLIHTALAVIAAGAVITALCREQGQMHLRKSGEGESNFELPFSVSLDGFKVECFPGTKVPADYVSRITIHDGDRETRLRISMNRIGRYRGWRIYQADYDSDRRGSYFSFIHDPYGTGTVYAGYALLLAGMLLYSCRRKSLWGTARAAVSKKMKAGIALAAAGFMIFMVFFFLHKYRQPLPVLRTWLLPVHVAAIMTAYMTFLVCSVIGIAALIVPGKRNHLRSLSLTLLYPACFLLVFGIIVGSVWSNVSWGGYWSWDPKETWALITALVYVAPFHVRFFPFLRQPKVYHIFMVCAIVCVAMTWFGVNLFMGGMHSYR